MCNGERCDKKMNPRILLYVLTAFYMLGAVLIIILAFCLPTMTWQNATVFTVVATMLLIVASAQMWGIERYVKFAQAIPDEPSDVEPKGTAKME